MRILHTWEWRLTFVNHLFIWLLPQWNLPCSPKTQTKKLEAFKPSECRETGLSCMDSVRTPCSYNSWISVKILNTFYELKNYFGRSWVTFFDQKLSNFNYFQFSHFKNTYQASKVLSSLQKELTIFTLHLIKMIILLIWLFIFFLLSHVFCRSKYNLYKSGKFVKKLSAGFHSGSFMSE